MKFRTLRQVLLATVLAGSGGLFMQASAQDRSAALPEGDAGALRHMVEEQQAAWNSGDGPRWAHSFSPDAVFINIRGDRVSGQNIIAELHTRIFSTVYRGSTATVTLSAIRPIAPGVALVEIEYAVTHVSTMPPGIQATSPGVLRTRMSLLAQRTGSEWQWVFAQNTAIPPAAGPPGSGR